MRTGNPVLKESAFQSDLNVPSYDSLSARGERATGVMTVQGTAVKAAVLLALCAIAAVVSWNLATKNPGLIGPLVIGGAIGGLVLSLVIVFAKRSAPFVAPVYAVAEGAFVGGVSVIAAQWGAGRGAPIEAGGVFQAILMTFGVFASMLLLYAGRFLKGNGMFARMVVIGTAGVMVTYLATWILRMFNIEIPFIHGTGPIGIGFSVVCVCLASFNLILDFQFIEDGAKAGAPKHLEWFGAFGLLVTLVWLYIEILRLLSKLKNR